MERKAFCDTNSGFQALIRGSESFANESRKFAALLGASAIRLPENCAAVQCCDSSMFAMAQ
jgi:hypothetical protein